MSNPLADPRVRYNDARHEYSIDGLILPSVSQIIKPICGLNNVPQGHLDAARMRGTYAHTAIEYLLDGTLDEASLHPEIRPYVEAFMRWADSVLPNIVHVEAIVTNMPQLYAGRVDLVADISGDRWLIDIKTTGRAHEHHGVQLAGYEWAMQSTGNGTDRQGCLYIGRDGTFSLKEYPFKGTPYFKTFFALKALHDWERNHADH